jgi:flagellar FliL protein
MKSILVISNDQRTDDLIRQFRPLLKRHIGSVADFDQGLKEVFDKRPAVVFIQSEIGGISGDAVAKHIKGLLRDDSPKLVLLREAPDKPFASRNTFDDSVDLFSTNEELFNQFKSLLEKVPTLQWCEPVIDGQIPAEETPDEMEVEPLAVEQPVRQPPAPSFPAQPTAETAAPDWRQPGREVTQQPPLYGTPPLAAAGTSLDAMRKTMPEDMFGSPIPGFSAELPGRSWDSRRPWLYIGGLLVTCAIGVAVFVVPRYWPGGTATDDSSTAAPQKAAVAPMQKQLRSLPAAIPLSGRDPAYETTHPGWERYQAGLMEYLVYREGGTIRAVQAICRRPEGISEEFIRSFLGELTGTNSYTVTGSADKMGYLAETAILPGSGELMLYRKAPGEKVRAFVVAFD